MKSDEADTNVDWRTAAQNSVNAAKAKNLLNALWPQMRIRERIITQAVALVPKDLSPDDYRRFWEYQATMFVQSPPTYILSLFKRCQEIEAEITSGLDDVTASKRKKILNWIEENGPTTMLVKLAFNLSELRYEYFTESSLKFLRNVDWIKHNTDSIFTDYPNLQTAFELAMARNDFNYFARIGDALRERKQGVGEIIKEMKFTNPAKFLLEHWVEEKNGIPALCKLSMEELTSACVKHLNNKSLTQDSVEKHKQRLGLQSIRS